MNFEAVLHYKHQNQGRDEKKKLRHASGASANSEASNSDSEVDSADPSPVPSPGQKKVNEVSHGEFTLDRSASFCQKPSQLNQCFIILMIQKGQDRCRKVQLDWLEKSSSHTAVSLFNRWDTLPLQDLSKTLLLYTVPAVQGFFRSISLSRGNNLQDTLR